MKQEKIKKDLEIQMKKLHREMRTDSVLTKIKNDTDPKIKIILIQNAIGDLEKMVK